MLYFLLQLIRMWQADTLFKLGSSYSDSGNAGRGYNLLVEAVRLNPNEPLYLSDLGYAAASASLSLSSEDATTSSQLKDDAQFFTDASLKLSPYNVSLWRTAIRTYYILTLLDPSFKDKTLEVADQTIALAPTDPKPYSNKALILSQLEENDKAIETLLKALELKPNYRDARLSLAQIYLDSGQKDKAAEQANYVLKMIPNDPDALKILQDAQSQESSN
jgi:tetratricopeptide (TPR) repeat protein